MTKKILVIGGTRFFGRRLVRKLLDAGHAVTIATRGKAADPFGDAVARVRVDRRDGAGMRQAFGDAAFDVVFDQMCYNPIDADISLNAFAGRVGRYVMASTIEVYAHLTGSIDRPFAESDLDLSREAVDLAYPWHAPDVPDAVYGLGKRQAEALFHQDGRLPVVSVRIGHVLGGPEDFTGRLETYVRGVLDRAPLRHSPTASASSFLDPEDISDFLVWAGDQEFEGPVNAASDGALSALDIHRRAARLLGRPALTESVPAVFEASQLSPFDYPRPFLADTRRAAALGYRFRDITACLDALIEAHARALADTPGAR